MKYDVYVAMMVEDLVDLVDAHVEYFEPDVEMGPSAELAKEFYSGDVVIEKIAPNLIKFIGNNNVCLNIAVWRMPDESPRE